VERRKGELGLLLLNEERVLGVALGLVDPFQLRHRHPGLLDCDSRAPLRYARAHLA
jgi:hypothetical protein